MKGWVFTNTALKKVSTIDKKTLFKKCAEVMYGFGCKLLAEIAEHKDVDDVLG